MPRKTTFTDHEIKHLEFIQGVIDRMGSNSFQMKSWMRRGFPFADWRFAIYD